MNWLVKHTLYLILVLLVIFATSCKHQTPNPIPKPNPEPAASEELAALLPEAGFEWIYNGFAEYGHQMKLNTITEAQGKRTYNITGEVFDASGGEAQRDFALAIRYVIDENSLVQIKEEEAMLDSKFDQLTLIKTPLVVGTTWEEQVATKAGTNATIVGEIVEATVEEGKKIYKVRHEDKNNDYFEERIIKTGGGIQSFEKLLDIGEEPFTAGYYLFTFSISPGPEPARDYSLTLYFPVADGSGVRAETRVIQLADQGVARAAINELIAGPKNSGLSRAVPAETKLRNIYIENAVCYVDFSTELRDKHWGGTTGESLTIASIVNTLTAFPAIEKVQILIDGQSGASIAGHIVLDEPLSQMNQTIK